MYQKYNFNMQSERIINTITYCFLLRLQSWVSILCIQHISSGHILRAQQPCEAGVSHWAATIKTRMLGNKTSTDVLKCSLEPYKP